MKWGNAPRISTDSFCARMTTDEQSLKGSDTANRNLLAQRFQKYRKIFYFPRESVRS